MNGSFYNNPTFPGASINDNEEKATANNNLNMVTFSLQQSLIENILRINKGKLVRVYSSYPDSNQWRDKIYTGIIEQAGKDHLILKDSNANNWFLLKMLYINYVEFDSEINYNPDYSDTFK